ncbi:23S rRNA (uracil(1939)-C(5))-methyltransferase RlmD [Candidatus Uhrbacteria bacterium]|mgnify:CR=1 FL=1|jgi:23S rRNA (uracil-5-)-methyltransferase RumA|nr:23S rRNA (uracil(1939)-C(5))-methyltransferase RlmD [Candidatus Uhrbacteria bacterium]MBT7717386.1 23S rRNA (uracil(1939)-C(5))-methyltransferase RlmD [Candidatus Uhrbacteria bacterium]
MNSPCPDKEACGSCGWSHISYDKQLTQKLSDINGSFKLKNLDIRCEDIIPAAETEHYRNRMDFVIDFEGRVGLRQKGKWWKVIDDHTCFISDEKIETHFKHVRDWTKTAELSFFDRKAHTGILRYAVIRSSSIGQTMINIVTSAPADEIEENTIKSALESLAQSANPTTLIWSINHTISDVSYGDELRTISGPGYIEEEFDEIKYRISPNAFFQTNLHTAPILLKMVQKYVGDVSDKTVLDLYCGSGFFSIALAKSAKNIIGVELVPEAIKDAKVNAEINDVKVEYHDAKTEEFDWKELNPDVVILDPPRSGMHDKALKDVIDARPKVIVYVSCNYKNFARELVELQKYYRVSKMRAIDMFPHTPHVELVTKLELK